MHTSCEYLLILDFDLHDWFVSTSEKTHLNIIVDSEEIRKFHRTTLDISQVLALIHLNILLLPVRDNSYLLPPGILIVLLLDLLHKQLVAGILLSQLIIDH